MGQQILLTGATGMLGKELIKTLLDKGYKVSILSRKKQSIDNVKVFLWDVEKGKIDYTCMDGVDAIFHLAGENIAGGRWTDERKKLIIDSRVDSARLLFKTLAQRPHQVKTFISAAAVGYYGDRDDEILTENSAPGRGFMAECCIAWEKAVDEGSNLGLRIVKLRTGVVLAKEDGALPQLSKPISLFVGAPLGSGKQWVPWIHHKDMTQIYLHALTHTDIVGVYNACAHYPVTNKTLTEAVAKYLHRPVWPINVPESMMKMILGEMSAVVLNSNNTSSQKLLDADFKFRFPYLEDALTDIYRS